MEELPKPSLSPPQPTSPLASNTSDYHQPVSVHHNAASHWSMLVAAVGVPILAFLMVGGLFLLPDIDVPEDAESGAEQTEQDRDKDEEPSAANPRNPATAMRLMTVVDAEERGAVCNDGSPAKYYFRAGTEENKDKWVIFFKGGGGCSDEGTCLQRAEDEDPGLISSEAYPMMVRHDGLLSPNEARNADFYNWNHVKLMYCSSDLWVGQTEQTVGGETWYFHGKTIVDAVMEDLQNPEVIATANLQEATQVLVAGSSAGGVGVTYNIDDIAAEIPNADVKGFIDGSWGFDVSEPYAMNDLYTILGQTDSVSYQNKQLDDSCVSALGEAADTCADVSTLYPYLETPTFVFTNQFDSLKLKTYGLEFPLDEAEQAWLDTVHLPELFASYEIIEDGFFSPKESFHVMLLDPLYYTTELDGVTIQEAFTNWFFDRPGTTYLLED